MTSKMNPDLWLLPCFLHPIRESRVQLILLCLTLNVSSEVPVTNDVVFSRQFLELNPKLA